MNHDLLKNIIYDQHELIQNADIVARPSYSFEPNANYVLVGLRRAGKSTLLFKIVQDLVAKGVTWEQIIYINFEDERLSEFQKEDFNDILSVQSELSAERGYFFSMSSDRSGMGKVLPSDGRCQGARLCDGK